MESVRLSSTFSSSSSSAMKLLLLSQVFSFMTVQISSAENQGCPDSLVSCPCGRDLMKEVDIPIEMCRNFTFGWFFPKLRCLTCHSLIPEAVCRPYKRCTDCRPDGISSCIPYKKDRQIRRNHCPRPLLLPNGHITVDKEPQPGSVVKYKCANRYVLKGQPKRTCGGDFRWIGGPPTCLKTMCLPPAGLKHGRIHYSRNQLVFNVNDRVSYSCDDDYVIYGESVRICGADGKWSGSEPFCSKGKFLKNKAFKLFPQICLFHSLNSLNTRITHLFQRAKAHDASPGPVAETPLLRSYLQCPDC
ncbi:complement C2-like [Octopus sinensis]|uniref:Complement C2-like n=1 Tax=Octopus sinensis TaxID=2607531 RepID=A0A6P7U9E6_9MOLL|nr:complement C2-like [Octopus sinensis]